MTTNETHRLCELFAAIIGYPAASLRDATRDCADLLERVAPEAAGPMRSFADVIESHPLETLEELYTQTFDVTAATTLYFGYHLFGETPKRSEFMARLQEQYESANLSAGTELPDHLAVILRFLAVAQDPVSSTGQAPVSSTGQAAEFLTPLFRECLLPIIERIETTLRKDKNVYAQPIHSLKLFLEHFSRNLLKTGGLQHA